MHDNGMNRGGGVCAVVVTYHPDIGFPERLKQVVGQAGCTLLIDNGSAAAEVAMLRRVACPPVIVLACNQENLGIARALNIGVQRAAADGFRWALLLDQDTLVDGDMVSHLLAAYASCDGAPVAIVGSRFRDRNGRRAEPLRLGARGSHCEDVESVITSGSLLSLSAYAAIGPFRDDFFIDHVDTEYCFRARAAGYRVVETLRPVMSHTVGAPSSHQVLWARKWTSNHSAERRYYIARNNTVMLREYGAAGGAWWWKSIVRCSRLCKRIALFEPDKLVKILAVAQGWWDAMRGRMGPRRR